MRPDSLDVGLLEFEVFATPLPYPIASAPILSTATAGVFQVYTADITNVGSAGTGAFFPYFFQTTSAAAGGGTVTDWTLSPPSTVGALSAGASGAAASPSFTFSSGQCASNICSIRLCADKTSSSGGGVVTEANEGNNCSAWRDVSVASSSLPLTVSLTASPFIILPGCSSTLAWFSLGATSCVSLNTPSSGSGLSGTASVSPIETTKHTIECTNASGAKVTASDTVFVTTGRKPIFIEG